MISAKLGSTRGRPVNWPDHSISQIHRQQWTKSENGGSANIKRLWEKMKWFPGKIQVKFSTGNKLLRYEGTRPKIGLK